MKEVTKKSLLKWKPVKVVLIHSTIGAAVFYFLVHPLTMIIYWLEFNKIELNYHSFMDAFLIRIGKSFHPEMLGMATVFIVIGLLIGLGSGFYYLNLMDKKLKINRQEGLLKRDIISVIQKGENDLVEYKSSIRYDYYKRDINTNLEIEILKTIAGFMNSKGGRLIIGVSDDGDILGLDNDYHFLRKKNKDGFELKLFQMISNEIGPEFCSFFQVFFYSIEEKEICVIEIQKSRLPVYVKQNKNTAFYLRVGNSTKKLSVKEAVNYINM